VLAPERLAGLGAAAAPKLARMRASLSDLGSVLVAFSGGVDSTFVLRVAVDVLGPRAVALTAISASVAPEERLEAARLAELLGARHILVDSAEVQNPAYRRNPTDRCYFCKSELYSLCERTRAELGLAAVVDGFNADDTRDHRPGHRAAEEARVHSPLAEAGLTKDEIRALSHAAGLPTWDKPAMPCLASRRNGSSRWGPPSPSSAPWGFAPSGCATTATSRGWRSPPRRWRAFRTPSFASG